MIAMNNKYMQILVFAVMAIAVACGTFIPVSWVKIVSLVIFIASACIAFCHCVILRKKGEEMAAGFSDMETKMKNYAVFREAAQKCVKLEERLSALDAVPTVNEEQTLGLQLSRLNNSLAAVIPDFEKKGYESLMDNLAAAVRTEELLNAFRDKSIRPFMDELKHCPMPVSSEDQARLLSKMMEVAMNSVDVVDVCRENINARPEQRLTKDVLCGVKTKEQAYAEAKTITDNPLETPVWARAIKSIAVAANVADRPVLYSGYKIVL